MTAEKSYVKSSQCSFTTYLWRILTMSSFWADLIYSAKLIISYLRPNNPLISLPVFETLRE